MSESVNGIDVYVTDITGTATSYIRESVVAVNPNDKSDFDTWETAENSVAGYQVVNVGGEIAGGDATGLANDTTEYTATITIDGTEYAVAVTGSAAQTYTNLITEINADLPGTEAAIADGNIKVTSSTTGDDSKVSISDSDLFSSLTDFVEIESAVDGNLKTYMMSQTLNNGANAWEAYKGAVEVYDTAAEDVIISSDYSPADLNSTFSDTEVEGELDKIATKVNTLQDLVEKHVLNK